MGMEPDADADTDRRLRRPVRVGLTVLHDYRPTLARLRSLLRSVITSFVVLSVTLWLLPGVTASGLLATLWLVGLIAAIGAVLRPLLFALATVLGGLGALAIGVSVQAIVMYVALRLDPEADVAGFADAFAAAWLALALAAVLNWLADAGTDDAFVSEMRWVMSRVRRRRERHRRPGWRHRLRLDRAAPAAPERHVPDGLLVVQLDGVAAPLVQWAIRAGNLPTIGRWLRTGSHRMTRWHTGLPATTPAAQAGLLYGDVRRVPAYRWYEKAAGGDGATGRLVVTSRPRDAAEIEQRLSTGRGLLRDGGVSISTAFSGDATTSLLTVSRAGLPGRSIRGYAAFMASPYGFARAVVRGAGQVVRELYEARRQRLRDIRPRGRRSGPYLALRPMASLLSDLNVSLIAEQMAAGAPVIFCDFLDYDEVAHHAGPARPQAMAVLEELDQTLGVLQRLAAEAARRYHIVVLSDHGQSQGATFRQRYGESLTEVVARLAAPPAPRAEADGRPPVGVPAEVPAAEATGPVEEWGRLNTLLTEAAAAGGATGTATRLALRSHADGGEVSLGPADREDAAVHTDAGTVVVASGNLAMIYLARHPGRLSRERVDAVAPGLIDGLAGHPGVGLVVVDSAAGPLAIGARGCHRLRDGRVDGEDPLAPYGPRARHDLLRHQAMEHVGDLVVISAVDPDLEEVAAFEELVGCHGGLGGWQTQALLVHPADWPQHGELIGPDDVHRQLLGWLGRLGLRQPDEQAAEPPHDGHREPAG
ncbi:phage holin family protein [Micromonospora sp. HK10]|uniref:phage holin family protein n=1 Tax=Micromonospora sp. HK10 TaxID=1538294 RepID=UPI000A539CF1|nr:phage holin family protein [Micromonospora sp. HK10]